MNNSATMYNQYPAQAPAMAGAASSGDGCLDWGDTIQSDGEEFIVPPEGDYLFQVLSMERGRHPGSAKLPPCNKATLILEIRTAEGVTRQKVDLFLHRSTEWRISAFFRAIGLKQKGENLVMDWNRVVGTWGRCHLRPRTYTGYDGQEHTVAEVSKFLDYDPALVKPGFVDVTGKTPIPF